MGRRAFAWLGGAMFAASLGLCAWTFLLRMGRVLPPGGGGAIAADAALITIFALHHSLFAREPVKRWLTRCMPEDLLRSLYVWMASALLMLVCAVWRPVGGELCRGGGAGAGALAGVQIAGLVRAARGVARVGPVELAGSHPA